LHGSRTDAQSACYLADASVPLLEGFTDRSVRFSVDRRPAEPFALSTGAIETSLDPLSDHGALELGEYTHHLKHGTSVGRPALVSE
jgi:hypothetical protein